MPFIKYLIQFQAKQVEVLINYNSEVNAISPAFVAKLGFFTQPTNVNIEEIDCSALKTYGETIIWF